MNGFLHAFIVTSFLFLSGILGAFLNTGKMNITAIISTLEFFPYAYFIIVSWIFYNKDRH